MTARRNGVRANGYRSTDGDDEVVRGTQGGVLSVTFTGSRALHLATIEWDAK